MARFEVFLGRTPCRYHDARVVSRAQIDLLLVHVTSLSGQARQGYCFYFANGEIEANSYQVSQRTCQREMCLKEAEVWSNVCAQPEGPNLQKFNLGIRSVYPLPRGVFSPKCWENSLHSGRLSMLGQTGGSEHLPWE